MNAFDKIAKPVLVTTQSSKSKIAAEVTDTIKTKVDKFVANKATLKNLEAEQKEIETDIIEHVRPQQDELAYCGTFTKSLTVAGKTSSILYSTMDKFSVPQDEDSLKELKKVVGTNFEEMFTVKRIITMKDEILKDEITLNKIATACEKAGLSIADIFNVGDKVIAVDDLDRKQYELLKKPKLDVFRTLVRQNKPALK